MSTSAIASVLDAICDGLRDLSSWGDVNVYSAPVGYEEAGATCVAFGDAGLDEEAAAMGGTRAETWRIDGEVRAVIETWQGDTEDTIRSARDRAVSIFAAVETYINDTYTGTLPDVQITAGTLAQTISAEGRSCSVLFTLTVMNLINP